MAHSAPGATDPVGEVAALATIEAAPVVRVDSVKSSARVLPVP